MVATLRVVLDQVASAPDADLALASTELARALVRTAPHGCEVEALVPAGDAPAVESAIPGLADVSSASLGRRELAASWPLGVVTGVGGGMIHSPTLMAPLVRHDRAHDHDQTVVTVWDLTAWSDPAALPRASVMWQKAMLRRAVRFADAVVVPTHAMGEWLQEHTKLGGRIRVISGAAPANFDVPVDEIGRRRSLGVPDGYVLVSGSADELEVAFAALATAGADLPIVVTDTSAEAAPGIAELASGAGIDSTRLRVVGPVDAGDRGALLGGAVALVAPSTRAAFPWRVVEALAVGVPVVAAASDVHREVIFEGGIVAGSVDAAGGATAADAAVLADALAQALGSAASIERLGVLAADRGRAFTWTGAAERVWQLHADL